jgi:hypothetical protein
MRERCLSCIPNGDCAKCQDSPIPEKFNVNFCPLCPRKGLCHFIGCIIDEKNFENKSIKCSKRCYELIKPEQEIFYGN